MERYLTLVILILVTIVSATLTELSPWIWVVFAVFAALTCLGVYDLIQSNHAILRNYPVLGHMRFLFEGIRPEIRQYIIESDQDEEPFSREQRSLVYQRAKGVEDKRPFGTQERVYDAGYAWLTHSIQPRHLDNHDFRVTIGNDACARPYAASLYNISAMSFGALSSNAILALNTGAKMGNFAHDTGEGGISRYHRAGGGDLIYEVGSGYFGCRTPEGKFCPDRFEEQAASDQVKMVEVKLSQGAKPGHGGMLPAAKISPEIAEARGVPMGIDCISPSAHSAFSTPIEFMEFLATLRERSGGKPVGFKLCIGHRREFMCMVKAMLETGVVPDFIVVDGKEGGTGAAPLEFANHVGMPLVEGLSFVHNTLRGAGLRDQIRLGAAGKLVSAFDIARAIAMGADWANSARGFMFAVGCIQAQACHTNRCPVGVATQDKMRARALDIDDKSHRVASFHRNTMKALTEMAGAAGLDDPRDFLPYHFMQRDKSGEMLSGDEAWRWMPEGFLLDKKAGDPGRIDEERFRERWDRASADSFLRPGRR